MKYMIELKPQAEKDLKGLAVLNRGRVVERLRWLEDDDDLKTLREEKMGATGESTRSLDEILQEIKRCGTAFA